MLRNSRGHKYDWDIRLEKMMEMCNENEPATRSDEAGKWTTRDFFYHISAD